MAQYPASLVHEQKTDMLRFPQGLGFEMQHVPDDLTTVRSKDAANAPQQHR
ncbi:MAG: hypothetical protein ACXWCY_21455 [Burkholderiales bacterium]